MLNLMFVDLFRAVCPIEFLNKGWQKHNKMVLAPNITMLINRFNEVSFWVSTQILTAKDKKEQKKVLKKFIKIAKKCEELHNFNSLMEILSSLNSASVSRLKNLWAVSIFVALL
jgi:son of sevenless-like protein